MVKTRCDGRTDLDMYAFASRKWKLSKSPQTWAVSTKLKNQRPVKDRDTEGMDGVDERRQPGLGHTKGRELNTARPLTSVNRFFKIHLDND